MKLPEHLPDETFDDYRKRNNLPHIYVPFFPGGVGGEQVKWQQELQQKFPLIYLYPYDGLQVSKGLEMLYILFEDESHITETAREAIILHCCSYGREHAEKVVPTVEELRERYNFAKVA